MWNDECGMRSHIIDSDFRIPKSAFKLEVIRLDEEPVLKTGGCRNVACEFESHGFRLGRWKVYRVQFTGFVAVPCTLLTFSRSNPMLSAFLRSVDQPSPWNF